jgi:hypothetical protein
MRSGTKLRKWMRCVLFFAQPYQVHGVQGLPGTVLIAIEIANAFALRYGTKLRK